MLVRICLTACFTCTTVGQLLVVIIITRKPS